MIALHHQSLKPKVHWLVTDPVALVVVLVTALLALGTYGFGGAQGLATVISDAKPWNFFIASIWGSTDLFAKQVVFFWYFAIVLHALEGVYVAYHAVRTFKLGLGTTLLWFYLVLCTGFPISKRFLELLKVQSAAKRKGNSKKHL
jgi:hypothetical protein